MEMRRENIPGMGDGRWRAMWEEQQDHCHLMVSTWRGVKFKKLERWEGTGGKGFKNQRGFYI